MSLKFVIKNTADKATKEGDLVVRYSGTGEPFNRHSDRDARTIETDEKGNAIKWRFATGLDEDQVEYYRWLSDEEKPVVVETIKSLKPSIVKFYGGERMLNPENAAFWQKRRDIGQLNITHENIDVFYDTSKPEHALLYLSIMSGAFLDTVAPNREWAESNQIPHYIALELEANDYSEEEDITRSDAHGELTLLRREFGKDALYILAWCLQYETSAFGAYNYSTSEKNLINYHIKYIDGKLQLKKKKNCPKTFLEYAEKWKKPQTRQLLYIEAYVKAGEYFNYITQREKKYVTSDGTILGNTIADAVKSLSSVKFKVDFDKLKEQVEAKWKE